MEIPALNSLHYAITLTSRSTYLLELASDAGMQFILYTIIQISPTVSRDEFLEGKEVNVHNTEHAVRDNIHPKGQVIAQSTTNMLCQALIRLEFAKTFDFILNNSFPVYLGSFFNYV